ncbi:MAG: hypothetical protein ABIS36_19765 [Chryseolinea sp.]
MEVNVQIVRMFIRMREMLLMNKEILLKLDIMERKTINHDADIKLVFKYLRELMTSSAEPMRGWF